MTQRSSSRKRGIRILLIVSPIVAAIVTSLGTMYQIANPQQIRVITDREIQRQNEELTAQLEMLEETKRSLEAETKKLKEQLEDTERQLAHESELSLNQVDETTKAQEPIEKKDNWFITGLKTWPVYLILFFSLIFTGFTVIGDIVGLFFGYSFDITKGLWAFSWSTVTLDWYWEHARWYGVLVGLVSIRVRPESL